MKQLLYIITKTWSAILLQFTATAFLFLICILGLSSCKTQTLNMPTCSDSTKISIPCQRKIENYLGIELGKCRDMHFYEPNMLGVEDYTVLISFEVPEDDLKPLFEQSSKLPSFNEFKRHTQNMIFLKRLAPNINWWKPAELTNAVCGVKSWCTRYEGDKCVLYAYAVVAFSEDKNTWKRVYICCKAEMLPSPELFINQSIRK